VDKAEQEKGDTSHVKYIINQQIKRLIVIALMIGYTYLQLHHIIPFNLIYLAILYVVGIFAIIIITHKIRIVSAHNEHCKKERHNHHD
jgi:4-hydroxybenzoate polyprenyltransferase